MKRGANQSRPDAEKTVGIWVRVSTEGQVKDESPEHHERRARLYAESKGWKVATVFSLEAVSGKSVMGHPETQRMLDDIRSGRISGIIFSKLARLARNTRELLEFSDIFRQHDADLVSLQESIDTSTPAGRLFYTMIAALAEWEREEIAARVAASVPIRAKLGKPLGGAAPFGYRFEGQKLVPDDTEAPVRRLVHELFLEHRRKKTVARLMNEAGHRTRRGVKFSDTTVELMLRDPTAKGLRRANYTKGGNSRTFKPESEWVLSQVEPIVSEELWEQCNALLNERQAGRTRLPAKRVVHLFAGLAFCHCGGKMYVPSTNPKYTCQKCRHKIPPDDLEAIFRDQLRDFFLSSEDLAGYLEQADEKVVEKRELLTTMESERAVVQGEMEKVYRLYVSDQISVEGFGRTYKPLEERLKALDDQLPRLQAELDFLRIQNLSRDEIISEAQDLYGRWTDLIPEEKRQIVENVVERITVGKGEVSIDLAYIPSPSEITAKRQTNPVPGLPFCRVTLKTDWLPANYPKEMKHLGDFIRKRRLDLGMSQLDVALQVGADKQAVCDWEAGRFEPTVSCLPSIIEFLDCDPRPEPTTFPEWLVWHRTSRGLSQVAIALQLGVAARTVWSWESGLRRPTAKNLEKVMAL